MSLQNRSDSQKQAQKYQGGNIPLPADACNSGLIARAFPDSSYNRSRGSGVACNQISGANSPGKIRTLRQVTTLVLGGENGRMATRCTSAPSRVFAIGSENRQCPLCVNAIDCSPRDVNRVEDVSKSNASLVNFHPGQPEDQNYYVGQQGKGGKHGKHCICTGIYSCYINRQQQQTDGGNSHYATKSGIEYLHDSNHPARKGVFA